MPMQQIQILIDLAKNGTDGHQMDQIMGKPSAVAKIKASIFEWLDTHAYLHMHQSKKAVLASIYHNEMPTVSTMYLIA